MNNPIISLTEINMDEIKLKATTVVERAGSD